jgi:HD-GYP domain-containing protein (c-di-GMP phosphodiesterase class II)
VKEFKVSALKEGSVFSSLLFLDDSYVLAPSEMPISAELIRSLANWNWSQVYSSGSHKDNSITTDNVVGENSQQNDSIKLEEASLFYKSLQEFTSNLYVKAALQKRLDRIEISDKVKDSCNFIKTNKRFILQIQNANADDYENNFLASHAARTTIYTIVIGEYLKLPAHRLIELGVAALTHEIGMVRMPPKIYMHKNDLTQEEREHLKKHTTIGFEILKSNEFPLAVCLPALEHHERDNGKGYPRSLTSDKIELYSKIIAVACSFEAITAKRPHKDGLDGYSGMTDMLRNVGKNYDDNVIRALVFSMSIFPIGLFVELSNGKRGLVVDTNPEDPRFPDVQLLDEKTSTGKNKVIKTSLTGVRIVRTIKKGEMSDS